MCVYVLFCIFFTEIYDDGLWQTILTEIVNDIADVQFDDIIAKLEAPKKKTDGIYMFIQFLAIIDVFQRK